MISRIEGDAMATVSNLQGAFLPQKRQNPPASKVEAHQGQSQGSQPPRYGSVGHLQNYFQYKINGKVQLT